MSVLSPGLALGDVILIRGVTNEWAVLWEHSTDGITFAPKNLSGWTATLVLRSPLGETWLSVPAFPSVNGTTVARATPAHLAAPEWAARSGGSWALTLTDPTGRVERLGQGYFHLEA
ncbi:hypothetical protein J2Y69_003349 [Microbacterium resistens]|uniref:Uncharacterized protein n=1 Tax=Microbacterium resistens TaxID=156977 RepID=A0ABU1SGJ9_9MICO|nr:hypothetical protein [Microbacterium resistens]MDR6868725.1 hypothetical protein [Microbacterium resistens]